MLHEYFIFLGLLASLFGTSSYLIAVVKGRVKPNRLSWFILGCAPLIAFAAEIEQGVGLRSIMTFWAGFAPLLIFFASFLNKNAYWKLNRFDLLCGTLAVVALVLWKITGSGNTAIALTIAADGLAMIPIIVKSWRFPHTEAPSAFLGGLFHAAIALLVLNRWTFADYAFPLYILMINAVTVSTIVFRRQIPNAVDTQPIPSFSQK